MSLFLEKNVDIEYHLFNQNFDGPLDLLLTLISREELDIREIFVSDITKQYLDIVAKMDKKDTEYAAEFIAMAARLLYIKTDAILPKLDTGEISAEEELYLDLEEYQEYHSNLIKIMQEGADKLRDREILYRFYREPQFSEKDYRVIINNFNLDAMIQAFSDILEKIEKTEEQAKPKTVLKEKITVDEKVRYLLEVLKTRTQIRFSALFDNAATKEEVINTFLAVLVLLKRQYAYAVQEHKFGDIVINITDKENTEKELENVEEYN